MQKIMLLLSASLAVMGCSDSSADEAHESFAELYAGASGTATGDAILGVWGGGGANFDTRWVFRANTITLANKCGADIVGVTVAAEVSSEAFRILASAEDAIGECGVKTKPRAFSKCPSELGGLEDCFYIKGKTMTLYSGADSLSLQKLRD